MIYNCITVKTRDHVVGKVVILRQYLVCMLGFQMCVKPVGASLVFKAAAHMGTLLLSYSESLSVIKGLVEGPPWHWFLRMHGPPVSCQSTRIVMMWICAAIMRTDVSWGAARESRPGPRCWRPGLSWLLRCVVPEW